MIFTKLVSLHANSYILQSYRYHCRHQQCRQVVSALHASSVVHKFTAEYKHSFNTQSPAITHCPHPSRLVLTFRPKRANYVTADWVCGRAQPFRTTVILLCTLCHIMRVHIAHRAQFIRCGARCMLRCGLVASVRCVVWVNLNAYWEITTFGYRVGVCDR